MRELTHPKHPVLALMPEEPRTVHLDPMRYAVGDGDQVSEAASLLLSIDLLHAPTYPRLF